MKLNAPLGIWHEPCAGGAFLMLKINAQYLPNAFFVAQANCARKKERRHEK